MFGLVPFSQREQSLFGQMGRILDDPFFKQFATTEKSFSIDIEDKGDHFLLEAELPGIEKDNITVSLDGDCMTIKAHREEEKSEEKKNYVYRERSVGTFQRRFDVSSVKTDDIEGDFKDGILTLTMPKKVETKPTQRNIEIGG
jgi:HSP20 family protein